MKKAEDLPEKAEQLMKEQTATATKKRNLCGNFVRNTHIQLQQNKIPLICQTSTAVDIFPTKDEDVAADYSLSGINKPVGNTSIRITSVHLQQSQIAMLNSDQTGLYERQKQGSLTDEQPESSASSEEKKSGIGNYIKEE